MFDDNQTWPTKECDHLNNASVCNTTNGMIETVEKLVLCTLYGGGVGFNSDICTLYLYKAL